MRPVHGRLLVFSIDEMSLLDVNELIDKDRRFTISLNDDQEYDNLEVYLKDESH